MTTETLHPAVGILNRNGHTIYYVTSTDGDRMIETTWASHANQIAHSRDLWTRQDLKVPTGPASPRHRTARQG